MRALAYACIAVGAFFSLWALSNIVAWWFVASWHVNREPIMVAFFLLVPAAPCSLLAPALAAVNRNKWPRHMLVVSSSLLLLFFATGVLFWFTNTAPS